MIVKRLLKPHVQIMELLAEKLELSQYSMAKQLGISYRTVMRRTKELENNTPPLIKFVREEPSIRGGKERRIYALTLNGLFYALKNMNLWHNLDKIAEYYKNELLIFQCWPLFTFEERETIKEHLKDSYNLPSPLNLSNLTLRVSEKEVKEYFDGLFTDIVVSKDIRPIIERIEILRKARVEMLRKKFCEYQEAMNFIKQEIEKLEGR